MYLPTLDSIAKDDDGTLCLQSDQYNALSNEASIAAAETGADREYDHDAESFEQNWITTYLGTDNWYALGEEPDDGYDYDKYH